MKNEWTIDKDTATRVRPGGTVEVDVEADGITVAVSQGSGYLREHTTAFIPSEVLMSLLEGIGWQVTVPQSSEEQKP